MSNYGTAIDKKWQKKWEETELYKFNPNKEGEKLYVYVGGHGADAVVGKDAKGGYNGGGLGTWDHSDDEAAGAGGGATDVRLISGEWNNFESLKSRIMVAAGGRRSFL